MYREMFERLPDNYSREGQVNNEKFYRIIHGEIEELKRTFADAKDSKNMDMAIGKSLDLIGKNVLEYRDGKVDDDYRKWIKIKIMANRSDGSIAILNTILDAYMKDDFISIEEGWKAYIKEPASIVVNISSEAKYIPFEVLYRIKAAGVRVYFTAGSEATHIIIDFRDYTFPVTYRICNMFRTDDVDGLLAKALFEFTSHFYSFDVDYPICNMFNARGDGITNEEIELVFDKDYIDHEISFKRVGRTTIGEGDI